MEETKTHLLQLSVPLPEPIPLTRDNRQDTRLRRVRLRLRRRRSIRPSRRRLARRELLLPDSKAGERVVPRSRRRAGGDSTRRSGLRIIDAEEIVLEAVVEGALLFEASLEGLEVGVDSLVGDGELLVCDLCVAR